MSLSPVPRGTWGARGPRATGGPSTSAKVTEDGHGVGNARQKEPFQNHMSRYIV